MRRLMFLALLISIVCWGWDRPQAQQDASAWTNPIGVPTPPVGIDEVAGRTTSRTIPATMHSGDVIDARGSHGDVTIHAECSARMPCFLRNGRFGRLRATGTGLIIEGITAYNPDLTLDHSAIRNSDVVGDSVGGGIFLNGSTYMTVRNVFVHGVGDVNATYDQDTHCVVVGTTGHHIWVLDSHLTRCSGDGVQVNAWNDPPEGLHHIYIARNAIHDNRQSALWAKQSEDVVFSENRGWGIHPNSGGSGPCYGSQYGSKRLVIIGNRGWECHFGINLRSSDDGAQPSTLIAWNVFHDLLRTPGQPDVSGHIQTEGPCMLVMTSGPHAIIGNDCVRTWAGIQVPSGAGPVMYTDNIFFRLKDVLIAVEGTTPITTGTNLIPPTNPRFVDALDFTLQAGSPAKQQGTANAVPTAYLAVTGRTYQAVHGVGLPETGPRPDQGAYGPALLRRREGPPSRPK